MSSDPTSPEASSNVQGQILIIDDDQSMCEVLETALSAHGFDVTSRRSADEGLRVLNEKDFDVVVTDVNMPQMSGVDLCRRIVARKSPMR